LVPGVGAVLARALGGEPDHAGIEQRVPARLAVERRDSHAPGALARQAPVGAQAHRLADAVLRARGIPAHRVLDQAQAAVAVAVVAGDPEPLVGGAADDRVAAAPAMGARAG